MIKFPKKRIFGLLGAPRSGKDTVAKYLQESRNFVSLAFADQVKEEFGITAEEFETAKSTPAIDKLRADLWAFSSDKKKADPEYFIRPVMEKAISLPQSVVITDIRTEKEFADFFNYLGSERRFGERIYAVGYEAEQHNNDYRLVGTKISREFYMFQRNSLSRIVGIENKKNGLYAFFKELDAFFFKEDVADLVEMVSGIGDERHIRRAILLNYIDQFKVISAS